MKRVRALLGSAAGVSLLAVALATACGDDDTSGSSSPRDAGPDTHEVHLPDTGTPAPVDAASVDANVEASFPQAWDRSKSARDASLEASAKYCAPAEANEGQFCWDFSFDDGITGWNEVLQDGGVHELVNGGSGNPLRSLQSTVFAEAGAGPHWVSLRYLVNIDDIPDAAAGITLSFSFRASKVGTAAIIGGLQVPGAASGPALRGLAVYPGGCTPVPGVPCLGENAYTGTDLAHRRPFDRNEWYRARIHLQPSGLGTGTVKWASTITVGDAVIAQHDTDGLPNTSSFPTGVNLFVGAFDTTVAGQTQVEIDDILLE